MLLTHSQLDILYRALGISLRHPKGYRNKFYIMLPQDDTDNYADCEYLVKLGFMYKNETKFHPHIVGIYYHVTEAGLKYLGFTDQEISNLNND